MDDGKKINTKRNTKNTKNTKGTKGAKGAKGAKDDGGWDYFNSCSSSPTTKQLPPTNTISSGAASDCAARNAS